MRDVTLFYQSEDIVAHYEKVDGIYIAHLTLNKWNKSICLLLINLLMDFCENIHPVIYSPGLDKKHEKFLKSVGFLKNSGSILLDDTNYPLYEWRIL